MHLVNRKRKLLKPWAWLNLSTRTERRRKMSESDTEPWESVAWALRREMEVGVDQKSGWWDGRAA